MGKTDVAMKYAYEQETEEKRCLECGTPISYGRSDKKFCGSVCKNHYHNRLSYASRRKRLAVNEILEENHRILGTMLRLRLDSIPLDELAGMGFNPAYFTSSRRVGCHTEYGCYDVLYVMTEKRIYNLRRE